MVITEKIDGNNFRFVRDGDELRFGSRNCDLGTDPDDVGDMFEDVAQYLDEQLDPDDIRELEAEWVRDTVRDAEDISFVFFGENAVQHTIDEYEWEEVPQFQLFDIWIETHDDTGLDGYWMSWYGASGIADTLGLETVPVVEHTTVGEFLDEHDLDEYEVPTSVYRDDDGPAEGVVFRNEVTDVKAKYISEEFAERHKSAKQGELVNPDNNNALLVSKHVTKRRIEKNVQKLIEEPDSGYDSVEMEMMEDLHEMVWRDVWEEDYEEIIFENWTIDLDQAHNQAASKCASYLQDLIQSSAQPVTVVDPETGDVVQEVES